MSGPFVAIIGDLVESRRLDNRAAAQRKLRTALDACNRAFAKHLRAPLAIAVGDEFQGLARPDLPFLDFWWTYHSRMWSTAATRLSFGVGEVTTRVSGPAAEMDGSCFHAARHAIDWARKNQRRLAFGIDHAPELGAALTQMAALLDRTIQRWTSVQWETVCLLWKHKRQVKVAEKRGVTPPSVHDTLESARADDVLDGFRGLEVMMHVVAAGAKKG